MNTDNSIQYGKFTGYLWMRCSGRGSFANSPIVKTIGQDYIDEGGQLIVIDLENCLGIDSTFMGTLAGFARRLLAIGGAVHIASPSARAHAALESLGLDALLEIDPPEAPWRGKVQDIRAELVNSTSLEEPLQGLDQARHVLDSHITLSELNPENATKFQAVTEGLHKEIEEKSREEKL